MGIRFKKGPKVFGVGVVVVAGIFGLKEAMQHGLIPTPGILKSVVATRVTLPPQTESEAASGTKRVPMPTTAQANVPATPILLDVWEWNAMFATIYANGGSTTTKGSLMEKYGVNLTLHREDSNDQMKADLLACAKQLHDGASSCTSGAEGIIVMGDGAGATWFPDLDAQLKKLGPEYQVEIVGAVGRSNGEDALLGPAEWKTNPQSMKGKTVVGVIGDGDWNIALNYEGSNGLKNNPDLKTYDPDAVNWISAPDNDYIKAVTEVFIPNRCEDRKVVKDGHMTGEMKNVCPDGVVTWYPGDEQAIHGRPGTVKDISSHEFAAQMPAVLIGIKKFFNTNRDEVVGFLAANFQAADQVKSFDAVRKAAGDISAKIYNDQTGDYWYKAYGSYIDPGTRQSIGGSSVFNLEDDLNYFGLASGHNNNMKATYETFAKIAALNYPDRFKGDHLIPPYAQAVDTSFILGAQALLNQNDVQSADAETVNYGIQAQSGEVRGKKPVYISFATGSDQILSSSIPTLGELKDALAINSQLALKLDGYTDNTGSDAVNVPLSQSRAEAVKRYLQHVAPKDFPDARFLSVDGHGSHDPIASNDTAGGKALNRRVEIAQIGQ